MALWIVMKRSRHAQYYRVCEFSDRDDIHWRRAFASRTSTPLSLRSSETWAEVAAADKLMMVDEDGVLRIAKDGDLAVVVPKGLQTAVLNHVHGTALTGHYRKRKTFARMRGRYWWKRWMEDTAEFITQCLPCAAGQGDRPL